MKDNFWNGNKIQWFEWTILLLSFGVIVEAIRYADLNMMNSGKPSGAGRRNELKASAIETKQVTAPASWRPLAEEALLMEMTLDGYGNGRTDEVTTGRDWAAFGIPPDEVAFFEFWRETLDTTLLDADGRLGRLLEARALYQSVGELLQQQMAQEAFFEKMQNLYRIPTDRSRSHYLKKQPSTAGQWAMFVAEHQRE